MRAVRTEVALPDFERGHEAIIHAFALPQTTQQRAIAAPPQTLPLPPGLDEVAPIRLRTTGDTIYVECYTLLSSVCFISDTRSVKEWFAECHPRQKQTHDNSTVCLVPDTRRACERSQQCLVGQFYRPPLGHLSTSSVK